MFQINQVITTKKPHSCSGKDWTIIRVGADYKIKCNCCGRELLLPLEKLEKIIKK